MRRVQPRLAAPLLTFAAVVFVLCPTTSDAQSVSIGACVGVELHECPPEARPRGFAGVPGWCDTTGQVRMSVLEGHGTYIADNGAYGHVLVSEVTCYTYDDLGRLVLEEVDDLTDDAPARSTHHVLDDRGYPVRTEFDHDSDGTPESIHHFEVDTAGNVVQRRLDFDADGVDDEIWTYEWLDAELWTLHDTDYGADGSVDRRERREYDEHDGLIREWVDTNADGVAEAETRQLWLYSEAGCIEEQRLDDRADGVIDMTFRWEVDESCTRSSQSVDADGDGAFETKCRLAEPCPQPYEDCAFACR